MWNRPWGPSSPTSPWSARLVSSIWSISWKGKQTHSSLAHRTEGFNVTNLISVLPQHLALRGHRVHVPVPGRRQVHVPLPSPEEGGHEQQRGKERDLAGGALFCNLEQRHINLRAWGSNHWGWLWGWKDWLLTGALALSKCKGLPYCSSGTKKAVYYTKDLFDFVLSCFCLFQVCVRNLHLYSVSLVFWNHTEKKVSNN